MRRGASKKSIGFFLRHTTPQKKQKSKTERERHDTDHLSLVAALIAGYPFAVAARSPS
jgi:hypothetical protein